jgi:hypothetical protein
MKNFSRSAPIVFVMLLSLLFAVPGIASAHTLTTQTVSTRVSSIQLNHKALSQITTSYSGRLNKVVPASLQCGVYRLNGWAGNLCVIVLSQCIGRVCAPYAVDLTLDKTGVNNLTLGGQTAAAAIITLLIIKYPALAPYTAPLTSGLNWSISQIGTFSRNVCDDKGAGVYIGFPSGFSLHC